MTETVTYCQCSSVTLQIIWRTSVNIIWHSWPSSFGWYNLLNLGTGSRPVRRSAGALLIGNSGCNGWGRYQVRVGAVSKRRGFRYDYKKTGGLGDAALRGIAPLAGKRRHTRFQLRRPWSQWHDPVDLWPSHGREVSPSL